MSRSTLARALVLIPVASSYCLAPAWADAEGVLELYRESQRLIQSLRPAEPTCSEAPQTQGIPPECSSPGFQPREYATRKLAEQGTPVAPLLMESFLNLPKVWNRPDLKPGTKEFNAEFGRRYGLSPPPRDSGAFSDGNDGLPFGLIKTEKSKGRLGLNSKKPGVTISCEACHSTSLFGKVVPGVGNPFFNFGKLMEDMYKAHGSKEIDLHLNLPGNTMTSGASFAALAAGIHRNRDLSMNVPKAIETAVTHDALRGQDLRGIAYVKVPAWIGFAAKESSPGGYGFFADGGGAQDTNFAEFHFLMTFVDLSGKSLRKALNEWKKCAPIYLRRLESPKYPFPIDERRARAGFEVYQNKCRTCHGRFDWPAGNQTPQLVEYRAEAVELSDIGTDPMRVQTPQRFSDEINRRLNHHEEDRRICPTAPDRDMG